MAENWCMWRPRIIFEISWKRQNRVLRLGLPICLYILAYMCDES